MTRLWRLEWSLVVVVLVLVLSSSVAEATGAGISLTTSPVSIDLNVKPGTSVTKTLQLMNNGGVPLKISMSLEEFKASSVSGQATIVQPAHGDPSESWVSFNPSSFIAQPGVWEPVKMTISLPATASLGYYFAVIFSPDITTTAGARSSVIKGSNGILVLVDTNSANERRLVNITSFSVAKKVYEYLPVSFNVSLRNSGNIFIAPFGNIYISRNANSTNTIAALNVNSGGGNVLPDSSRDFSSSWADGFPVFQDKTIDSQVVRDAKGQPVEVLKWNFNHLDKLRFGKYYAKLTLIYNDGQRVVPISSVVSFWVLPWKILGLILAVVIIVGIISWLGRKRIRRAIRVLMGKE